MAPKYAPDVRSRLAPLLLFLQTGFIILYYFSTEIESNVDGIIFSNFYPVFQDLNVMVFLGFGFLSSFLVRYGFSASGFSFLIAVMATQWALILNGIESWYYSGKIKLSLRSLGVAEMCTASVLISIGAVQGKTNHVQLILMALLEVFGFVLNEWLLQTLLSARNTHCIMVLHIFGAFFGLVLTWILYRKESEQGFEKEKLDRKAGLFSMLGTVFLWMFWPSFNSVLVDDHFPERKLRSVCSTYLALAVSAVASLAVSALSSPEGKVHPANFQSCIFAGGVAVGVSMSVIRYPWEAMTIGLTAAAVSTTGFRYLKSHMLFAFECHDTCSVLSTHGLPGLLGWLTHLLLQIKQSDDHTTAIRFAVFHICVLLITITVSLTMGIITGVLLKWDIWRPPQDKKCFDDQAFWMFEHLAVRK
ncbi:rh blood group, D antigen isoform X2 [Corythoichthys intestinalis]|uniref:rh blood group, D antigen isoform X2 n=1 Tax=Corythoichthys intestinalis TaxID=161448 RepID=UPI0025A670F6|nr:rh blood group, D antigen isoform X2 [Corythoichthys intestinalis]XP_061798396.1 ammonium transporter Rh type B-like [Nerophis lumbriciformis]